MKLGVVLLSQLLLALETPCDQGPFPLIQSFYHSSAVNTIALSSDDSQILAGSSDGMITVRNLSNVTHRRSFFHGDRVMSVAWNSLDSRIATGSFDRNVKVWNGTTLEPIIRLGRGTRVTSVAWSPDGRLLAAGALKDEDGTEGSVVVWDAQNFSVVAMWPNLDVFSVAWRKDSAMIVVGSRSVMFVADVATGEMFPFPDSNEQRSAVWSPDGKQILSGDKAYPFRLRIWDAESYLQVQDFVDSTGFAHVAQLKSVAWSHDQTKVLSTSEDLTIKIWKTSGLLLFSVNAHGSEVQCGVWNSDSTKFFSGSKDHMVKVWDAAAVDWHAPLTEHRYDKAARCVAWSNQGELLAASSADSSITIWTRSGTWYRSLEGHEGCVRSVAWSPDDLKLASGGGNCDNSADNDYWLRVWTVETSEMKVLKGQGNNIEAVAWSIDGAFVAVAANALIEIWDVVNGTVHTSKASTQDVKALSWSPNSPSLVFGTSAGAVWMWNSVTGAEYKLTSDFGEVRTVAWSPDGKLIAAAGGSEAYLEVSIKVWSADRALISSLVGPCHVNYSVTKSNVTLKYPYISSLAWSPDSSKIVVGESGGSIKIWRLRDGGSILQAWDAHNESVESVAWNIDRSSIASASKDHYVKTWRATFVEPVAANLEHTVDEPFALQIAGVGLAAVKKVQLQYHNLSLGKVCTQYSFQSASNFVAVVESLHQSNPGMYFVYVLNLFSDEPWQSAGGFVVDCPAGYSLTENSTCVRCTDRTYARYPGGRCVPCIGRVNLARTDCVECPENGHPDSNSDGLSCICNHDFYLDSNETNCVPCPSEARCTDGTTVHTIVAKLNFWQTEDSMLDFLACVPGACCDPDSASNSSRCGNGNGSRCAVGYQGPLCGTCAEGFGKTGFNKCEGCLESTPLMHLVVIGGAVGFLVTIGVMLWLSLRAKPKSLNAQLGAIVVNAIQINAHLFNLNLPVPTTIDFLRVLSTLQSGSTSFASFSCVFGHNALYLKLVVGAVLPPAVFSLVFLFELVRLRRPSFHVAIAAMAIVIFVLHDTLATLALSIFSCQRTDHEKTSFYISSDLAVPCYRGDYFFIRNLVCIPVLVFYVFGTPLAAVLALRRQNDSSNPLWFLVNGLKTWYWFVVIAARKVLIIFMVTFLSNVPLQLCALTLCLLLAALVHLWVRPYDNPLPNLVETISLCISITIFVFASLLFSAEPPMHVSISYLLTFLFYMPLVMVSLTFIYGSWNHAKKLDPLHEPLIIND